MFWQKKRNQSVADAKKHENSNNRPTWFNKQLEVNVKNLCEGDHSCIAWLLCAVVNIHDQSKLMVAEVLRETLDTLSFDDVIRIDEQIRQTTSMEWSINWRELNTNSFFTPQMNNQDKRALIVFASFNPNGYIREQAVTLMQSYDGTLPYILMRQNDWVLQVRQAATAAFTYRLQRLSDGEIFAALPFAERLRWSNRSTHGEYTDRFFKALTAPQHATDLMKGLRCDNVGTRRICIDVLFSVSPPKVEWAYEQLTRETEPFLRAMIFKMLCGLRYDMDSIITVFLRDRYPVNRKLAFQYLLETNASNVYDIAKGLLLDSSLMIRETARNIVQQHASDFNFRKFYHDNLEQHTAAAIYGIGEVGQTEDAAVLEKYLEDIRVSVVRAAMASLMRLNGKAYIHTITDMLDDSRAGVVKTARNLVIKAGVPDYERLREIFTVTVYEHVKLKCMDILFSAPKWPKLIYMLAAVSCDEEPIRVKAFSAIQRWLDHFNRSFVLPSTAEKETIQNAILDLDGRLPAKIQKELLLVLPSK